MSVLKNKRGQSKLEFYNNAMNLSTDITLCLMTNFGVTLKTSSGGKQAIAKEDGEEVILGEHPEWLLNRFRNKIMTLVENLLSNITAGNSIYPTSMEDPKTPNAPKLPEQYIRRVQCDELADRRRYQTAAIGNCYQLIESLQYFTRVFSRKFDTFKVSINKIIPFIDALHFEIRLLKGWRKQTNDLAKKLLKGELKGKVLESK